MHRRRSAVRPRAIRALRPLAWAAAFALAASGPLAPADSFDGSTTDAWDVAQGTVVTAHSPVSGASAIEDLFGGANSSVETRSVIFADGKPAGTVHFVEWRTAAPVAVDGYVVRANDDFSPTKARGFSAMRLFARNQGSGQFEQIASYDVARNPYGEHILLMGTFAEVTAQEFRAEFVQAGGSVSGGPRVREIDAPPAPVVVDGAFLPLKGKAKLSASAPAKSKLTVSGILDTGSVSPSFGTLTTLSAAGIQTAGVQPVSIGSRYRLASAGFVLDIVPSPIGSSRTTFKLAYTGDLSGKVSPDGEVPIAYADSTADVGGRLRLEGGRYALRGKGSLRAPTFQVAKTVAKVLGPGKDRLALTLAASRIEDVPTSAIDVRLRFGDALDVLLPADAFRRRGSTFVLAHPVGGVKSASLDYDGGAFRFAASGLDLSAANGSGTGPVTVRISLALGVDRREVVVRLGRKGKSLRY